MIQERKSRTMAVGGATTDSFLFGAQDRRGGGHNDNGSPRSHPKNNKCSSPLLILILVVCTIFAFEALQPNPRLPAETVGSHDTQKKPRTSNDWDLTPPPPPTTSSNTSSKTSSIRSNNNSDNNNNNQTPQSTDTNNQLQKDNKDDDDIDLDDDDEDYKDEDDDDDDDDDDDFEGSSSSDKGGVNNSDGDTTLDQQVKGTVADIEAKVAAEEAMKHQKVTTMRDATDDDDKDGGNYDDDAKVYAEEDEGKGDNGSDDREHGKENNDDDGGLSETRNNDDDEVDDDFVQATNDRSKKDSKNTDWPRLSTLVDGDEVIGDVQFLLDFAIVGHSKTSTTAHMWWLADHPEIQMDKKEVNFLNHRDPAGMVRAMYDLPHGRQYKRGYKSPHELQRAYVPPMYEKWWPNTDFIVGLRHPVKWFESYYNFQHRMGNKLPPAETFVGEKFPPGVRFHEHLARIGKTDLSDPKEYELLGRTQPETKRLNLTGKVFLYEVAQPYDEDQNRVLAYCEDLSNFLGLSQMLEPMQAIRDDKRADYHYKIDVCKPKYKAVREELLEMGRNASQWLQEYFLVHPDVVVSSPEHFRTLVQTWGTDPCLEKKENL